MWFSFFFILCCFLEVNCVLFPIVDREKLYKYVPPENDVTFHLYHRNNLSIDDPLFIGDINSLDKSRFDPNIPTKILTHGWTHGKDTPWLEEMREAMALTGDWNIIVADWSDLSHVIYVEARLHTNVVGKQVKNLILFLSQTKSIPISFFHIIGHSMGGQIAARAGNAIFTETGQKVSRITGLDPAGLLYEWPHIESLDEVLDPSDADFVDVIHTNGRHLGMITPAGHVDFYPDGGEHQRDCQFWACSHIRACELWTASIYKPDLFRSFSYREWDAFVKGETDHLLAYPMGIAAGPDMPQDIYFVEITDEWKNLMRTTTTLIIIADPATAGEERKQILKEDQYNATNFMTLWEFEGIFKYSPFFYGWYTNSDYKRGYRLPLAYFVTGLVVYAYSFFAILRKMAENSRMSKLSEKDDECIFSWKLFTGWDYMIGNAETAHNRVASIVMGFKEALLEEAEKKKDTRNWRVICLRILVNLLILGLFFFSGYAVVVVVKRSEEQEANDNFWRKNEITIVLSLLTSVFPILFEILGFLEQYHPRKQLRLQLARIMVLNLLNLYSLIFALFVKIDGMTKLLEGYRNITKTPNSTDVVVTNFTTPIWARRCSSSCSNTTYNTAMPSSEDLILDVVYNVTNTTLPNISKIAQYLYTTITPEDVTTEGYFTSTQNEGTTDNMITFSFGSTDSTDITEDYNMTDLKNSFVDYLTYILSPFVVDYNHTANNLTDDNLTRSTPMDDFETFKSTVLPTVFNYKDDVTTESRFDQELSSIYDDISSTITTLKETVSSTEGTTALVPIEYYYERCVKACEDAMFEKVYSTTIPVMPLNISSLNYTDQAKLRSLCWETMFGQELIKLTVMDMIMTFVSTMSMDFFRGLFVRVMNRCWCWDLEKKFPQYGDFKVAENILSLVNNQGMVWMGMFFSPGLVLFNVVKLYVMMYFRAWAVLTCNVPHEVIFRASRSNNFYYALLLMMLFLCVLPVGYAIVWIKPSWHCGPFSGEEKIFHILTKAIKRALPDKMERVLDYITSPGIVIPLLVLLILVIYYLLSLTAALRGANEELKIQLKRERTEERRKMFQMADRRRRGGSGESNEFANTAYSKWKKLLGTLPSAKSLDESPKQETDEIPDESKEEKNENKGKDFFSKLIKKALGKSSTEDEPNVEDGTDTEQHDSLPDDSVVLKSHKPVRTTFSWGNTDFQFFANKTLQLGKGRRASTQKDSDESNGNKQIETNEKTDPEVKKSVKECVKIIPSTSKSDRQDSECSVWSDNIPVITISKTESAENILDKNDEDKIDKPINNMSDSKFKPKVRCALKKQNTEIDEDVICYFGNELERSENEQKIIKEVIEGDSDNVKKVSAPSAEIEEFMEDVENISEYMEEENIEILSDKSSSESSDQKASVETILNVSEKSADA